VAWVGLWVQSFYLAMGWVGLAQSFGGLGWVEEIGPTDNSELERCAIRSVLAVTSRRAHDRMFPSHVNRNVDKSKLDMHFTTRHRQHSEHSQSMYCRGQLMYTEWRIKFT